ncbi:DUF6879 family protein [Streptomyces hesseae]|uniref:DUF6879 domain-containing protein n=1 Tax=Streptomyces hesseae TaxID=3075519 RepID=A0ABU2SXA6_9ACTN|nr:DUF6879 family protein [Streptomyces sp. DSM 40473]MDT0453647.1 hypothetical protein [Streptomyces sp. DSM 40473]
MKPPARESLPQAQRSAIHLEVRDHYHSEDPDFLAWREGRREFTPDNRADWWEGWHDAVHAAVSRGVTVRRARVVSEPLSEYVRWEYAYAVTNVAAGEQVRWLPRRHAKDLAVPAVDFWVFDGELVLLHHFSGDGVLMEREYVTDGALAAWCTEAFEAVWKRATPHEEYKPV